MTQFFSHQEAFLLVEEIAVRFPDLSVEISDINNHQTGEYHYSYVAIWGDKSQTRCIGAFSDFETYEQWLNVCQYITQAIADNQQSEEIEQEHSLY